MSQPCDKCDGSGLTPGLRSYCGCKTARECGQMVTIVLPRAVAESLWDAPFSFEVAVKIHEALKKAGVKNMVKRIATLFVLALALSGCGKHTALDKNLTLAKIAATASDANYRAIIKAQADDMRGILRDLYEAKHQAAIKAEIARGKTAGTPDALEIAVTNTQALERVKIQKYQEFEAYFAQVQAKVDAAGKDTEAILMLMDNAKAYLATEQNKAEAIQGIVDTGGQLLEAYLESTAKIKPAKKTASDLTK